MDSLQSEDLGLSIFTLEEALQTFETESEIFKLRLTLGTDNSQSDEPEEKEHFIRMRKEQVFMDGQERIIIMIRDFTDSIVKRGI